jgi:hypothetical protein
MEDSLAILSTPNNTQQLHDLWNSFAQQPFRPGPGAQPFSLVIHALRGVVGGEPLANAMDGAALLQRLKGWNAQTAAGCAAFAERFLEEQGRDPLFSPGEHLGGECENALFEWTDAALTLLTTN